MPDSASNVVALFPPENQQIQGKIESRRAESEARKAANAFRTRNLHSHETIHPPDHASVARSAELPQNVAMDTPTRQEFDAKLDGLRQEMRADSASLRADFAGLRSDMHEMNAGISRWMLGTVITVIGTVVLGFAGLTIQLTNSVKASTSAASQPPAIIINVPPAAPAPAASR